MFKKFISASLCFSLLMQGAILPVMAQTGSPFDESGLRSILHEGSIGTAIWTIDSDGVLTIGEGEFSNDAGSSVWPWTDYLDEVQHIDGTAPFKISGSLERAFENNTSNSSILSIDLSGWDTSEVTDMSYLFADCSSVKDINISSWRVSSVENMHAMFYYCESLVSLDINSWIPAAVTDMGWMFNQCSNLIDLNIGNWDTSSVENMSLMFNGCSNLTSLDLNSWNTSCVTDMKWMFLDCTNLSSLNISSWNTSKVKDMRQMFSNCSSLSTLNLESWDVSAVENISEMFLRCKNLTSVNLRSWTPLKVSEMYGMFGECENIRSLNLGSWNTAGVQDMYGIFWGCHNLTTLDISNWDATNAIDISGVFAQCDSLNRIHYSNKSAKLLSQLIETSGWYQNNNGPYTISTLPALQDGEIAVLTREPFGDLTKKVITNANVTGISASYDWTGKEIKPTPVVTYENIPLTLNTDYTVSYQNNVNPGNATILITGIGDYTGIKSINFQIIKPVEPQRKNISTAIVSNVAKDYGFTGKAITPDPKVTLDGTSLVKDKDYTVAYSKNINPGTATITITGKGNYAGTKTVTFQIVKTQDEVKRVTMHRLYNPNSGEHFYTAAEKEENLKVLEEALHI